MAIRPARGSRGLSQPRITHGDAAYFAARAVLRLVEETGGFADMTTAEAVERIRQVVGNPATYNAA